MIKRSKYNVSSDKTKRTYDDIVFDSELEMKFYRDVVKPQYEKGIIKHYELQKEYILQEKFKHDGKTVLPIKYVADFYIEFASGQITVIDTKGMADDIAKLKRKMMWYLYPEIDFKWVSYVKKYGGWRTYDDIQKARREEKKLKKQLAK